MADGRTRFGLRDCATDDEAASEKQDSVSLEEFSDSQDSDEALADKKLPIKDSDPNGPVLDRQLSWGGEVKPADAIVRRLESVKILEKPVARRGSMKEREENGVAVTEEQSRAKGKPGVDGVENGRRKRRTQSWADMTDGEDEDEYDAVIDGWAAVGEELDSKVEGEESESGSVANSEENIDGQDKGTKNVASKKNEPYNVPTSGTFYLHDDRWEEQPIRGRGRGRGRGFQPREQKWKHDKFEELEKVLDYQRRREKTTPNWKKKPSMDMEVSGIDLRQKLTRQPRQGPPRHPHRAKSLGGDEVFPTISMEGLPQGVSYDQLKLTRGGKRISHRAKEKGGPWRSCDGVQSVERQGQHSQDVEKQPGRGNQRRRGFRGNHVPQQSKSSQYTNGRSQPDENGGQFHKRASSVEGRVRPELPKGSDQADWRTPPADGPSKQQVRVSNQKRINAPNGNAQLQKNAEINLQRESQGAPRPRPTHRRRFSEGSWQQARVVPLASPKFQLNPNALPFQKVSMNPDATPFIPPDTMQACASSAHQGL